MHSPVFLKIYFISVFLSLFNFTFIYFSEMNLYNCITVLSQWDFSYGKFGLLSLGKASCDRVALPKLQCMLGVLSVSIIHRTLTRTTGSLACGQMLMHAIAHGDVRTHVRESTLKGDSGGEKNPLAHRGIEPVSAA